LTLLPTSPLSPRHTTTLPTSLVRRKHREYDLKIELEEGAPLPPGRLYSISPVELETLWGFINENLRFGFIHPTSSSHAAPVLFVKKKDGSL